MKSARVELFGSALCPYCYQARGILKRNGIAFAYREVLMVFGYKPPLKSFREMKERSGGQTTVPQIFVDGRYYGDEERLVEDERAGRLELVFKQTIG